jgi:starch-binding outer membrane protein, SusD/RagB family
MNTQTRNLKEAARAGAIVTALLASTGCGDLFTVENPGLIEDATLESPTVFGPLVAGIAGDFSVAMGVARSIAELSFEMQTSGPTVEPWSIGVFEPTAMNNFWGPLHKARWVAENGIERMKNNMPAADFAKSALVAEAQLFAGFSNRYLGENFCYAVIDGGPAQPRGEHFKRAEQHFTQAMATAQAAGASAASIYTAALAGRAEVKAWQGNWAGAVQDAGLIPIGFKYQALFSANTAREENNFYFYTWRQWYATMANTPWLTAKDPRTPFVVQLDAKGGQIVTRDGRWPAIAQAKYPSVNDDIDIVSGRGMLLLRAEAALRNKDIAGATALMNASRATYNNPNLAPLPVPATEADAWKTLVFERGATLWLEGRRFWDLTRWFAQGVDQQWKGRAPCMPIGKLEMDSNPNLQGFTGL